MQKSDEWPTGFMVVQGNRMEDLCDVYVQWLKRYPIAPLANEVLLTQSNGIAQWLKQTLAQDESDQKSGCGVTAGIQAMLPAQFVWRSYCALLPDLNPQSVYDKKALTWRFYRLLATWPLDTLAPLLKDYVEGNRGDITGSNNSPKSRFALASQLADLYDQYQIFRPDWLADWQQHQDQLQQWQGSPKPLPEQQQWQANIWRALCEDIQQQSDFFNWSPTSRSHLHQRFVAACAKHQQQSAIPQHLPPRVVVFGLSSLPIATLDTLKAIAPFTQILLFVMNPSQYYWGDLVTGRDLLKRAYKRQQKKPQTAPLNNQAFDGVAGNPLLATWGKQGRDFLHLCDEQDLPNSYQHYFKPIAQGTIDLFSSPLRTCQASTQPSLLSCVQDDILHLRTASERADIQSCDDANNDINDQDSSLQFISAHSRQREVEILHDQLLADFAHSHQTNRHKSDNDNDGHDKPLQPKDILVMVPDIVAYAPHIDAVFGRHKTTTGNKPDARYLPYHITDTGERYANPLLAAYELLLNLPHERLTSAQGLTLLEVPDCQACFGIKTTDLPLIKRWIKGSNIRWAIDASHRDSLGLPAQAGHNTWQFGIDRLLLGYMMAESGSTTASYDDTWQGVAPYAEVTGLTSELLGKLSHFVQRLSTWQTRLQTDHTPAEWASLLLALWHDFFDSEVADHNTIQHATSGTNNVQLFSRINQHLQQWLSLTQQAQLEQTPLPIDLVTNALFEQLEQTNLSSHFITGAINFATLMPMRAVPFRQIWLLGMNDGDYPRHRPYNDFDLMVKDYRPGDRSRREDDRYLFLEALLSAREKLVISWHGRNIKDDSLQPPSVLVSQLQDYLDKGWPDHHPKLTQQLTHYFPLQAFSDAYFSPTSELTTYAHEWQKHKQELKTSASIDRTSEPTPDLTSKLPAWLPEQPVNAQQLTSLLRNPVEALYEQRFQIKKPFENQAPANVETFALDGLQTWQLQDYLINQQIDTQAPTPLINQHLYQAFHHWQHTGTLLSGYAGQLQAQPMLDTMQALFAAYAVQVNKLSNSADESKPQNHCLQSQHKVDEQLLTINIDLPYLVLADPASNTNDQPTNSPHQQCLLQPNNVIQKNGKVERINLANSCFGWVQHLAAHLYTQQTVATYIFSPKGHVHLAPLDPNQAEAYFQQLITCWYQAMHAPLPIAIHLGETLATLTLTDKQDDTSRWDKFSAAYEDDKKDYRSWVFTKHYPQAESLPIETSQTLADNLYLPMLQHSEVLT